MGRAALIVGIASISCLGCNRDSGTAPEMGEAPKPSPSSGDKAAPSDKPLSLAQGLAALPEAPPLGQPMSTQLGNAFFGIELAGVSQDRRAYAMHLKIDDFYGEDGGGESKFSLYVVYDTWTGQAIAAFRDRGELGQHGGQAYGRERFRRYKEVWEQAGSRADWAAWRRQHRLTRVAATREPKGGGRFELQLDDKAMQRFNIGALESSELRDGFSVAWFDFYDPIQAAVAANPRAKPKLPQMHLSFVPETGRTSPQLTFTPRLGQYALWGEQNGRLSLLFHPYVDTSKGRVFWVHTVKTRGIEAEAHPPWGRFYVRALGPRQVKIVAAGSGMDAARRVAALFEQLEVTVTQVEASAKTTPISTIYYRGSAIELAKKIQAFMPGSLPVSELSSTGWVDVIVVLGRDAELTPTSADK